MKSGIVFLCALVLVVAPCQLQAESNSKHINIQILESWKEVTVKLLVPGSSATTSVVSRLEEVRAKRAAFKIVPAPQAGRRLEKYEVVSIHDPYTKKRIFINGNPAFYLSDSAGMKGYCFGGISMFWFSSYLEVPDSIDDRSATAQFERECDGQRLMQDIENVLTNRITIRHVLPPFYFTDHGDVGGSDVIPQIEAADVTNGVVRLALRHPDAPKSATLWIDLAAKKVIKSVADGQEMDVNPNKPWSYPLKPK